MKYKGKFLQKAYQPTENWHEKFFSGPECFLELWETRARPFLQAVVRPTLQTFTVLPVSIHLFLNRNENNDCPKMHVRTLDVVIKLYLPCRFFVGIC